MVHNCLHNKAHPQHLGGHWFFCPLYHQSRIIYLLPFSDCSCFLMPSTVAVSRISPMEGDRRPPPLLQPLPRPHSQTASCPEGPSGQLTVLPMSSHSSTALPQEVWPPQFVVPVLEPQVLQQPCYLQACYLATTVSLCCWGHWPQGQ